MKKIAFKTNERFVKSPSKVSLFALRITLNGQVLRC